LQLQRCDVQNFGVVLYRFFMDVSRFSCAEKSLESFKKIMLLFVHRIEKSALNYTGKCALQSGRIIITPNVHKFLLPSMMLYFFMYWRVAKENSELAGLNFSFSFGFCCAGLFIAFANLSSGKYFIKSCCTAQLISDWLQLSTSNSLSLKCPLFLALTDVTDVRRLPART
jgi:hypothetical protein